MVPTLVGGCQFGTRRKKSVNCVPTFEKVHQGPFQKKIINTVNGMPRVTLTFFYFFLQIFCVATCQVPVLTRGNVNVTWQDNATCDNCHCTDLNLVSIYTWLFQFSPHFLCLWFNFIPIVFNNWRRFFKSFFL